MESNISLKSSVSTEEVVNLIKGFYPINFVQTIYEIFNLNITRYEVIMIFYECYRSSIHFGVDMIQKHGSAEKSAIWIPPAATVSRPLLLALGRVDMEVCLEKTSVTDGEPLVINVSIVNHSNKNIRGMKV